MQKIIGIALVLAVIATLSFSSLAFADGPEEVYTEWDFDGKGHLEVLTQANNVFDVMRVSTEHGGSSFGHQSVTSDNSWLYTSTDIERGIDIDDGIIDTYTARSGWFGPVTEYSAFLDTEGAGYLSQSFQQDKVLFGLFDSATMDTDIWNYGDKYEMGASLWDDNGWNTSSFGIGAKGDGGGYVGLDTSETRFLFFSRVSGDYEAHAENGSAGFEADSSSRKTIEGFVGTPSIDEHYDYRGAGYFGAGGTAEEWVDLWGNFSGKK